jgi:bifunctional DNase/RNase
MVEAEIWTIARMEQGNAVLLRPLGSEISVPIFIGQLEAQSILIGYGEVVVPRPLTHDLLLNLLRHLGLELIRIEVHDLRDNTFYARLILTGQKYSEKNPLILDSRPSDAFALAVRRKCPVFIAEKVVEQAGVSVDLVIESSGENGGESGEIELGMSPEEPKFPETRREILQMELEKAVAAEEYERAAEIRDIITLFDQEDEKNRQGSGGARE